VIPAAAPAQQTEIIMLDQYTNVPRLSNVFIAEQRYRIDPEEMGRAKRLDAAEPATAKAWREILSINGQLRQAILMLRLARENCGQGYKRVEVHPTAVPGWFESRKWTSEFVNECQANVLWFLADRKAAWATLRRAEAMS
jgi:hypothetical protein